MNLSIRNAMNLKFSILKLGKMTKKWEWNLNRLSCLEKVMMWAKTTSQKLMLLKLWIKCKFLSERWRNSKSKISSCNRKLSKSLRRITSKQGDVVLSCNVETKWIALLSIPKKKWMNFKSDPKRERYQTQILIILLTQNKNLLI